MRHHSKNQPWWGEVADCRVEFHPTRSWLESAERLAIRDEGPLYNKRSMRRRSLRKRLSSDEWDWAHGIGEYASRPRSPR